MKPKELDYSLIYSKKRRTIAIQVKAQTVSVRAPYGVNKQFIDDFVVTKRPWIDAQLQKQRQHDEEKLQPLVDKRVMLFAEPQALVVRTSARSGYQLSGNTLTINVAQRVNDVDSKSKELLMRYLADCLQAFLLPRVAYWQQRMGVVASAVKIRVYKRRWGSCNQRRELSFNTLLVGAPKWVIDYVIVHELAHIRYMNHGQKFWQLVEHTYAHSDDAKQWLKHNGNTLELQFE